MKLQAKLLETLQEFVDVELMADGDYYVFNVSGDRVRITAPILAMMAMEIKQSQETRND